MSSLPPGQDGWLGEFSGGQQDHLQWKEGEVYLLPLSEEDTGFYKASGESKVVGSNGWVTVPRKFQIIVDIY